MNTYEEIIKRICEAGKKAYLVGGAVRDEFLGIDATDYDVVTNALPSELETIFPDRNVKMFGYSFLVTSIDGVEVATYRTDKNFAPGRNNCITEACKTLDEDLSRRDFTFNSLAVCPYTGDVIDPFNGMKDLKNKVVKFVSNPEKRIHEDYLRMIRAARFTCLIEGSLHPDTFDAICNNKVLVNKISPERVGMELLKVMKYKRPSIFFDVLFKTGILEIIMPEFHRLYGSPGGKYHAETLDQHCLLAGDSLPNTDPILRLAGYFHDIGKAAVYDGAAFIDHEKVGAEITGDIMKRLKFKSRDIQRVINLVNMHMRSINDLTTRKSVRKFLRHLTDNNVCFKDFVRLKVADKKANLAKKYFSGYIQPLVMKVYECKKITPPTFGIKDLAINGFDIMNTLNINPGKKVGDILNLLFERVIDDPKRNNREELINTLKSDFR